MNLLRASQSFINFVAQNQFRSLIRVILTKTFSLLDKSHFCYSRLERIFGDEPQKKPSGTYLYL